MLPPRPIRRVTDRTLSLQALERAHEALHQVLGDLSVAVILAPPRSALATDADVLADAIEAEQAAVLAAIERHG